MLIHKVIPMSIAHSNTDIEVELQFLRGVIDR
jgi:hypothetical protein